MTDYRMCLFVIMVFVFQAMVYIRINVCSYYLIMDVVSKKIYLQHPSTQPSCRILCCSGGTECCT